VNGRILVVDDERLIRETLDARLGDEGHEVRTAAGPFEALELLEAEDFDVIVTDLRMPSMDGLELQRRVRQRWPDTAFVFMTAFGTIATAVEAMREGAVEYLTKPLNTEELVIRLDRIVLRQREVAEIRRLRLDAARTSRVGGMVFRSAAMAAVLDRAVAVADTDVTVLVEGETGTGKEVLARVIHDASGRASGPFVAVNCAGLNPNLVESELFGHESGAFTGAQRQRKGRIETAAGGTLFIDEVDDLTPEIQVRLLRFLNDRTFERVGGSRMLKGDVRVLCATKKSLPELVRAGRFRDDLYYRINTVVVELPPLRARPEDIVPLAQHFAQQLHTGRGAAPIELAPDLLRALRAHDWPGNVRELAHAMEHAVAFAKGGTVEAKHLPARIAPPPTAAPIVELHLDGLDRVSFPVVVAECERLLFDWALKRAGGNQVQAAELLMMPRTSFRSRLAALRGGSQDD
jgi:DNA-binding NtrC family response regulator